MQKKNKALPGTGLDQKMLETTEDERFQHVNRILDLLEDEYRNLNNDAERNPTFFNDPLEDTRKNILFFQDLKDKIIGEYYAC